MVGFAVSQPSSPKSCDRGCSTRASSEYSPGVITAQLRPHSCIEFELRQHRAGPRAERGSRRSRATRAGDWPSRAEGQDEHRLPVHRQIAAEGIVAGSAIGKVLRSFMAQRTGRSCPDMPSCGACVEDLRHQRENCRRTKCSGTQDGDRRQTVQPATSSRSETTVQVFRAVLRYDDVTANGRLQRVSSIHRDIRSRCVGSQRVRTDTSVHVLDRSPSVGPHRLRRLNAAVRNSVRNFAQVLTSHPSGICRAAESTSGTSSWPGKRNSTNHSR